MINLRFRAKVTLKAAEKLDSVNSFISIVVALEDRDESREGGCHSTLEQ